MCPGTHWKGINRGPHFWSDTGSYLRYDSDIISLRYGCTVCFKQDLAQKGDTIPICSQQAEAMRWRRNTLCRPSLSRKHIVTDIRFVSQKTQVAGILPRCVRLCKHWWGNKCLISGVCWGNTPFFEVGKKSWLFKKGKRKKRFSVVEIQERIPWVR